MSSAAAGEQETAQQPAGGEQQQQADASGAIVAVKKFHNGWTPELEYLTAEWADKAACYRWMHDYSERDYTFANYIITIPVIILSTLTGTANFGMDSLFGDDEKMKKMAQLIIGGVSLFAGILTTLGNFLRFAQGSEAHRGASISWGKFNRHISIELVLHPDERMESMAYLKMCRVELDRLIEQSPPISTKVVRRFLSKFGNLTDVKKPEIADGIEHTRVFIDKDERVKKLAKETALAIQPKKGILKQMVMDDLDTKIKTLTTNEAAAREGDMFEMAKKIAEETAKKMALEILENPNAALVKRPAPSSAEIAARAKADKVRELSTVASASPVKAALEKLGIPMHVSAAKGPVVETPKIRASNTLLNELKSATSAAESRRSNLVSAKDGMYQFTGITIGDISGSTIISDGGVIMPKF